MDNIKNVLAKKIAGEVVIADNPYYVLKKWRKILNVSQISLARAMNIMPSVISDYENGRRKSPGILFIKKLLTTLVTLSHTETGVLDEFNVVDKEGILDIKEFIKPVTIKSFIKKINGQIIVNGVKKIYGYTIIDSLRAIIEFSPAQLLGLYGMNTDRALIFTDVSTGRSPMIAIKIGGIKPSVVVLQAGHVDDVAKRIAEVEDIPLIKTSMKTDEIIKKLKTYN